MDQIWISLKWIKEVNLKNGHCKFEENVTIYVKYLKKKTGDFNLKKKL